MEPIRANPLLRLIFTVIAGVAAGAFFIGVVLLVLKIVGSINRGSS
jgi:hypothetical protein